MPLHISNTMCSSSGGQQLYYTASDIITPIGVMIPEAVYLYMFRAPCAHRQEVKNCIIQPLVSSHL